MSRLRPDDFDPDTSTRAASPSSAGAPRALAVVIGRAGSRGLPGKNERVVGGLPMVAHSIADALGAATVDRVVVSTDGEGIAAAARAAGVEVVTRPPALANDTAAVDAAVRHAVETCGSRHEHVVILYANVPIRPPGLIDRAMEELVRTGADSVQSYAAVGKHHPWWMVRIDEDGRVASDAPRTVHRRQELPPVFLPDGGVIAVTRAALDAGRDDDPHAFFGADRRGVRTGVGEVVDVDDEVDLRVAEAILARRDAEREAARRAAGFAPIRVRA